MESSDELRQRAERYRRMALSVSDGQAHLRQPRRSVGFESKRIRRWQQSWAGVGGAHDVCRSAIRSVSCESTRRCTIVMTPCQYNKSREFRRRPRALTRFPAACRIPEHELNDAGEQPELLKSIRPDYCSTCSIRPPACILEASPPNSAAPRVCSSQNDRRQSRRCRRDASHCRRRPPDT
jgi:hypothetical protein